MTADTMLFEGSTSYPPNDEDVKEVYAQFGLTYYFCEVLHRGLCNLYLLAKIPEVGLTSPRAEELLKEAWSLTLGLLVAKLEVHLPAHLYAGLAAAVIRRNFVAHHFWYERIHLMATKSGPDQATQELSEAREEFKRLDAEVEMLSKNLLTKLPICPDDLARHLADGLSLIRKGIAPEPLIAQRPPRRHETINEVYLCRPHGSLVFVADDQTLWQLCEVGLGWTAFSEVGRDWVVAEQFIGLLPAVVSSRPSIQAHWNYDIPFGRGATLVLRSGMTPNAPHWQVKRRPPRRDPQLPEKATSTSRTLPEPPSAATPAAAGPGSK